MKPREMTEMPSRLSWDAVLELMRGSGDEGFSNKEIASALDVEYGRARNLTSIMWENGALSRVHIGEVAGATFYFLPMSEVTQDEQRAAAF